MTSPQARAGSLGGLHTPAAPGSTPGPATTRAFWTALVLAAFFAGCANPPNAANPSAKCDPVYRPVAARVEATPPAARDPLPLASCPDTATDSCPDGNCPVPKLPPSAPPAPVFPPPAAHAEDPSPVVPQAFVPTPPIEPTWDDVSSAYQHGLSTGIELTRADYAQWGPPVAWYCQPRTAWEIGAASVFLVLAWGMWERAARWKAHALEALKQAHTPTGGA